MADLCYGGPEPFKLHSDSFLIRTFIRHSAEQKNEQRQRQTDNILQKTTKI